MRTIRAAAIAVLPFTALTLASAGTAELDAVPPPPAAVNNPDVPREIIDALPELIRQDPHVVIDPELVPGPIVHPDGTPVAGQDAVTIREARARCGGTATATAAVWGPESIGGCTVWGSPGYRQGYAWGVRNAAGSVCAQGRGFTVSGTRTWYSIGCGKSTAGAAVAWGNVLSNPSVRAMTTSGPINSVAWWI